MLCSSPITGLYVPGFTQLMITWMRMENMKIMMSSPRSSETLSTARAPRGAPFPISPMTSQSSISFSANMNTSAAASSPANPGMILRSGARGGWVTLTMNCDTGL